jgi:hypothetical protein
VQNKAGFANILGVRICFSRRESIFARKKGKKYVIESSDIQAGGGGGVDRVFAWVGGDVVDLV